MAHRTVGAGQSIALTGTATTSTAFKVQSNVVRIVATGADAYVAIGTDPVATNSDYLVSSSQPETLAMLKMSQRVSGITTGTTTVISCPEGTQMPFRLGDRVSIDGANFAHYNVLLSNVQVIGKSRSAGVSGDFAEKITVKADTSGITTAFDAGCHASLFMSNRVPVISPNPTAAAVVYIQQVQTTGSA
jgi:hypothetical protein